MDSDLRLVSAVENDIPYFYLNIYSFTEMLMLVTAEAYGP